MALALRKAVADCEAGSGLKNFTKELQAVSPKMVGTLDFESIKALTVITKHSIQLSKTKFLELYLRIGQDQLD